MATKGPRVCGCGKVVPSGERCLCQQKQDRERKARHDAKRPTARQRGYTAEWTRESKVYLADYPSCRRCGALATLVDHIQPHKGNQALFWNRANWQPLCTPCHSGAKQSQERRNQKKD